MNITSGILILLLSSLITFNVQGQSRKDFILKYKHIAIQEMERTGIPASITLAGRSGAVVWIGAGNVFPSLKQFRWGHTLPNYGIDRKSVV